MDLRVDDFHRNEYLFSGAKAADTRARRISKTVEMVAKRRISG